MELSLQERYGHIIPRLAERMHALGGLYGRLAQRPNPLPDSNTGLANDPRLRRIWVRSRCPD